MLQLMKKKKVKTMKQYRSSFDLFYYILTITFIALLSLSCSKVVDPDADIQYCKGFDFINGYIVQCTEVISSSDSYCERHK